MKLEKEQFEMKAELDFVEARTQKPNAAVAGKLGPLADAMKLKKQLGAIKAIIANPNDDKAQAAIDRFSLQFGFSGESARQRTVDFLWRRILTNWDKSALQKADVEFYKSVTPRVGDLQTALQFDALIASVNDEISTEMWKLRQAGIEPRSLKTGAPLVPPSEIEDVFDEDFGMIPEGFEQ